jgi:hypothetical protein
MPRKKKAEVVIEVEQPVEQLPHPEQVPVVIEDVIAAMEKFIAPNKTMKVVGKLPQEKRPPQDWFDKNDYIKTIADMVHWCSYYFDGDDYYILRNWEVSHYFGSENIGDIYEYEAEESATLGVPEELRSEVPTF